eukprot:COSAG02_NODE_3445_length_6730_cov_4.938772_1_plen_265_part_00
MAGLLGGEENWRGALAVHAEDGSAGGSGHNPPHVLSTEAIYAAVATIAVLLVILGIFCQRCRQGTAPPPIGINRAGGTASPAPAPPPSPLPIGLVLAVSVPKVVSQTYLCFSVAGGTEHAPESVRWTVQKRCSQFEDLAFTGALQARAVADPALASLTWPPRRRGSEDPQQMELRRAYADRWARHLAGPGGLAWNTKAFRDFVALDEHLHQLEDVLGAAEAGTGSRKGPSGHHQQYATDSGLFDAGLQQRLLDTDTRKGDTRRV